MFSFLKKPTQGERVVFTITGMHCTSCSFNIDGTLEDIEGVIGANTSYAKSKTIVEFDPKKTTLTALKKAIESLDYAVTASQ